MFTRQKSQFSIIIWIREKKLSIMVTSRIRPGNWIMPLSVIRKRKNKCGVKVEESG